MHASQDALKRTINTAKQNVTINGKYVHYKNSSNRYKVIDLAINTGDGSVDVIYQALYGERIMFVRPLTEWLDSIDVDGASVSRFTLVTPTA